MRLIPTRSGRRAGVARFRPGAEGLESRQLLSADLQLSESAMPTTVAVGQPVQYTLTATNDGLNSASNVVVVDAVPENYQFVTSTPPSGIYDPTAHLVYFNLGTLSAGQSQTLNFTVVPTQVGAWSDWASIYSATGGTGMNTTSTRITALPSMPPQADVGVQVTAYPTPSSPGSKVTYQINASNYGPNTATGVVITDALPISFSYKSSSPGGTYDPATNSVIFNLGDLAFGQTVPLQVVAVPNNAGDYTNWVDIRSQQTDPVESNNDASLTIPVHTTPTTGIADVVTYQNVKNTPNDVGKTNTYHVHVQNLGPDTATGVVAVDYLPYGVTYKSASIAGTYNPANNSVSFAIGTMAAGSSQDIDIKVTGAATGTWDNRILARATQQDASPTYYEGTEAGNGQSESGENLDANNTMNGSDDDAVLSNLSASPYAILPSPLPTNTDIQIVKMQAPVGPVVVGQPVTYTMTISNNGPDNAPNVLVTDQLSGSVTYQSSSSGGTLLPTLGIVEWNLGSLAANQTENVSVTVVPTVAGQVQDLAIVRPGAIDTSPGNNTYTNSLSVMNAPQVDSLVWYGKHHQPTSLAVTYNQPMDPATAGNAANYRIVELGRSGRLVARGNHAIGVRSVSYLASQQAAIVYPSRHLNLHRRYALIIQGAQPGGVRNIDNVPLLDNQTFTLGGQYVQGFNSWYWGQRVPEVPGSPFTPPAQTPSLAPSYHYRHHHRPLRG